MRRRVSPHRQMLARYSGSLHSRAISNGDEQFRITPMTRERERVACSYRQLGVPNANDKGKWR